MPFIGNHPIIRSIPEARDGIEITRQIWVTGATLDAANRDPVEFTPEFTRALFDRTSYWMREYGLIPYIKEGHNDGVEVGRGFIKEIRLTETTLPGTDKTVPAIEADIWLTSDLAEKYRDGQLPAISPEYYHEVTTPDGRIDGPLLVGAALLGTSTPAQPWLRSTQLSYRRLNLSRYAAGRQFTGDAIHTRKIGESVMGIFSKKPKQKSAADAKAELDAAITKFQRSTQAALDAFIAERRQEVAAVDDDDKDKEDGNDGRAGAQAVGPLQTRQLSEAMQLLQQLESLDAAESLTEAQKAEANALIDQVQEALETAREDIENRPVAAAEADEPDGTLPPEVINQVVQLLSQVGAPQAAIDAVQESQGKPSGGVAATSGDKSGGQGQGGRKMDNKDDERAGMKDDEMRQAKFRAAASVAVKRGLITDADADDYAEIAEASGIAAANEIYTAIGEAPAKTEPGNPNPKARASIESSADDGDAKRQATELYLRHYGVQNESELTERQRADFAKRVETRTRKILQESK